MARGAHYDEPPLTSRWSLDKRKGKAMAEEKGKRARVWAGIIYPDDSAPSDWLSILDSKHIPMAISPLHGADETDTKPHRHVLMHFDGKKSYSQVKAIMDEVNGTRPEAVGSVGGYARYLCHLDNEDKPQYDITEVISLAGFEYGKYLIPSGSQLNDILCEIDDFILDNCITEYITLVEYARKNEPSWVEVLHSPGQSARIQRLITSFRHAIQAEKNRTKMDLWKAEASGRKSAVLTEQ